MRQHKHVADVIEIPCELIRPSGTQQRETTNEKGIDFLVEGIRANGQVEAALVRPIIGVSDHDYELVSGERRWRACSKLKKPLRAIVLSVNGTEEQFALACAANNHEELTPMEICNSLWVLYRSGEMQHVKKEKRMAATARRFFGRGHQWAWNHTGLARLDERLQPLVKKKCSIGENIPIKIAVRLAGLPENKIPGIQMRTWEEISCSDPSMTVSEAQLHITRRKDECGVAARGRPLPDSLKRFRNFVKKVRKDVDALDGVVSGEDLGKIFGERPYEDRRELNEDLTYLLLRLEVMRGIVLGENPDKRFVKKVS